ncbi:MAG: putative signal transducing protein [Chloroflexota bacterium]
MKRLYCSKDPLMIGHLKNVMATFGIKCVARKLDLNIGAGELPPIECWPELWVLDDEKFVRARSILKKTLAPLAAVKKPWHCAGCGETIEGQFSECWNCGRDRSGRKVLRLVRSGPPGNRKPRQH